MSTVEAQWRSMIDRLNECLGSNWQGDHRIELGMDGDGEPTVCCGGIEYFWGEPRSELWAFQAAGGRFELWTVGENGERIDHRWESLGDPGQN